MAFTLWGLQQWPALATLSIYLFTPLAIAIGGATYFAMTLVLRVEEATMVPKMILRRR